MMTQNTLIGVRDPYGIRPWLLVNLAKVMSLHLKLVHLILLEQNLLEKLKMVRLVYIENDELKSIKAFFSKKIRPCVFEYIYFSRPDSILNGEKQHMNIEKILEHN